MTALYPAIEPALGRPARTRGGWWWAVPSVRWASAALGLFLAGLVAQLAGAPQLLTWMLYLACYVAGGWEPAWAGVRALRERTLDVDLLMIVAAIGAAAIGQVFDGALLIVIFATSGALEDVATTRTERSVRGLLDLAPEDATLRCGDGSERVVAAADLRPSDVIIVRPGERISADGRVIQGCSEVDQSSITGEPLPASKSVGSEVFAGTLNGSGALCIEVTREPSQTVVARIVAMVAEASATKATTQLFIEKIERRYSVIVVAATLALLVVPLCLGADLRSTLLRAMTFMIVASPCAVVLATMPPLLCAIANASRHGVLVKSAVAMERLADTDVVVFDKTGTLTAGEPVVSRVVSLGAEDVLGMAAAAEEFSEHPLGRAIVAEARGVITPGATDFAALPGRGVRACVAGRVVDVVSPAAYAGTDAVVREHCAAIENDGGTAVVVLADAVPVGVIGLVDRLRPDAPAAVARIAAVTTQPPMVLTGDNLRAAARLGDQVGITDIHAELLPDGKAAVVQDLQRDNTRVLVVGDGVNDAPAMAAAHTSIAMGRAGADLTVQTADVVTIRDELGTIPTVMALARRARRVVIANLVIAGTAITGLVIWDLLGHLPLPLGVAGHEGSTILVALNGLRLLTNRAWTRVSCGAGPT